MASDKNSDLMALISKVVDNWADTVLKNRLITGTTERQRLGLWDSLKRGISNLWYGKKYDHENPYRWRNRFGDALGVDESFNPGVFTLSEYAEIRRVVDSLESELNEGSDGFEKLRLAKLIKSAAEELKTRLFNALKDNVESRPRPDGNPKDEPTVSTVAPPAASEPPSSPAAASEPPSSDDQAAARSERRRRTPSTKPAADDPSAASSGRRRRTPSAKPATDSPAAPDAVAGSEDSNSSALSSIDQDENAIEVLGALRHEQPDLDQLAKDWRAYKSLLAVGMAPRLKVISGSVVEQPSGQPITYKWLSKKVKNHKNHELMPYVFGKDGKRLTINDSVSKIYGFTKTLHSNEDASIAKNLNAWAKTNLYGALKELSQEDKVKYIYENLISESKFIDSIAEFSRKTPDEIKNKMIEFAKSSQ